ncbi:MAG: hypothetical protein QNL77_01190 [Akkermansiaceae bacterium]
MASKNIRWTIGIVLILCWITVLFEERRGSLWIEVDTNTLFLGLSILLAAWGITMSLLRSQETISHLESDYLDFISALSKGPMALNELEQEAGKDEHHLALHPTPAKLQLSKEQHSSLKRLIYEGKISLQDGKYSLPS